jgi:predicted dehydrogenase
MVGGGTGAFIGAVHRMAARLDDQYVLTAGAFSSNPEVGRASAEVLRVAPERAYASFEAMAEAEAARDDGVEVVAVVTPNHLHFAPARAFLQRNVPVMCDKPLTSDLGEAIALRDLVAASGTPFGLTYNYSGYPMLRLARQLVADGELGAIRLVQVEYVQDWLADPIERDGQKQASWRTDPAKAGAGGSLGDIGSHAAHLAKFVSGLSLSAVSGDLTSFVPGRMLDDNAHVLLRFHGGAKGMLWTSQVAHGHANDLTLRVYGDKGGLAWRHEDPEVLSFTRRGEPTQRLRRGAAAPSPGGRIPGGHPEGYLEAFATLYAEFADQVRAWQGGQAYAPGLVPTADDGVDGLRFIEAAVASSRTGGAWTPV